MAHAFVDTSAWCASVNRLDADHIRIHRVFQTFQVRLVTSNFSFDETVTVCLYRLGYRVAAMVGEGLLDPKVVDLLRLTPEDEHRAWTLLLARPDKTCSYTDCTAFVLMRRLRIRQAIALDADSQSVGFLLLPALLVSCLCWTNGPSRVALLCVAHPLQRVDTGGPHTC